MDIFERIEQKKKQYYQAKNNCAENQKRAQEIIDNEVLENKKRLRKLLSAKSDCDAILIAPRERAEIYRELNSQIAECASEHAAERLERALVDEPEAIKRQVRHLKKATNVKSSSRAV